MNSPQLLRLLHLSDPTLPVGGFAHSAGLETYVQQGLVHDKATALAFVSTQLQYNQRYNDAAFVSLAYDAARSGDLSVLLDLDQNLTALKVARELREASQKMGLRLLKMLLPLQASEPGKAYLKAIGEKQALGHYAIVFGLLSAAMAIEKEASLTGYLYNTAAGMVTNSVKLVPLGQQDGQELMFKLHPIILQVANDCLAPDPEKLGMCCTAFDIRSMQHERLYSRLYMS